MSPTLEAPVFIVRGSQDLDDLLRELRQAAKDYQRTGGAYTVWRKGDDGRVALRVTFAAAPPPQEAPACPTA